MKATYPLVRKTVLEILIESCIKIGDKETLNRMIEQKESELEEAINNAEFQSSIGLDEMADNETSKAKRLMRDIAKLKAAI